MNNFILRTLSKFDKLTTEQAHDIFEYTVEELGRLESVLDSIYLGILVCDAGHKLTFTNCFARRLLNIEKHGYGTRRVWNFLHDKEMANFLSVTLKSGDKIEGREFHTHTSSGSNRILSFNVLPLVRDGHVAGSVIIFEDVTRKRLHESNMHRIESLASLTTLAAGVAHDIKNPLASISIHIQLSQKIIDNGMPSEKIKKHLDIVLEEIERLNHTVVDFLFAVRPMDLTLIKGDINGLLHGIMTFMQAECSEHGIECVTSFEDKMPLVEFDERYLKEALLNLIKNAIEAMKDGGKLTIRTRKTDFDVRISIKDSGEGISEENQEKIFEPYWTTKDAGTGLGLTRVFKIIREHRGEISLISDKGKGATFTIRLPLPQEEHRLIDAPR